MSLNLRSVGTGVGLPISRRQMLADDVYQQLKSLIMDGSIPPGLRINIEDVSRQLEVSPTPVREALARLESDGLVNKSPLKGYRTTALLNRTEVSELYELRLLLEPSAAANAARNLTSESAAALSTEIASCSVAPEGQEYSSYRELSNHDERLHDLILTIAGNRTIRQALERTHCHLHINRLSYVGTFGQHTLSEHQSVVDALLRREADEAEQAMRQHLTKSHNRILSFFDSTASAS
ncbi:GntR family transcriptional regulator [Arthrobacter tecti]